MKSWLFIIRELLCMRSIHPYWIQKLILDHYDMVRKYYDSSHQLVEENQIVEATLSYGKMYLAPEKDSIIITLHYDRFIEKNIVPFFPDAVGRPVTVVIPPSQVGIYEFFKPQLDDMLQFPMSVTAEFDFGFDLRYQKLNMAEMLNRYRCECSHSNPSYLPMKALLEGVVEKYNNLTGKTPVDYLRKTLTNIDIRREGEKTFTVTMTCFPQTDCDDDTTITIEIPGFTHLGEIDMWIGIPNTALCLMSGISFATYMDFTGWHGSKEGAMLAVNVQDLVASLK